MTQDEIIAMAREAGWEMGDDLTDGFGTRLDHFAKLVAAHEHRAIEQAEKQEPFGFFQYDLRLDAWVQNRNSDKGVAFYTHPQPKREWVGLTDEEIQTVVNKVASGEYQYSDTFARAIEAKLRERNT